MTKDDKVKQYPNSIDTRVALLEASVSHINETLQRMERKLDKQFDSVDREFGSVTNEFKELRKEMKFDFIFTIGAICALGAIMAHGFHWF